jgi:hypothetical protein
VLRVFPRFGDTLDRDFEEALDKLAKKRIKRSF